MKTRQCRELKWTNGVALEQSGAACTPCLHRVLAFTLVEMLVVIAIIGMLAGLVLYLGPGIHDSQRRKTVHAQMEQISALIEYYKEVNGFYPPAKANVTPEDAHRNTLYYELTGTPLPPNFDANLAESTFGVGGIINVTNTTTDSRAFFKDVKETQWYQASELGGARILGIRTKPPTDGPAGFDNFCPWYYRPVQEGDPTFHNSKGFDLWMRVELSKGPTIIGNWKDKE